MKLEGIFEGMNPCGITVNLDNGGGLLLPGKTVDKLWMYLSEYPEAVSAEFRCVNDAGRPCGYIFFLRDDNGFWFVCD